MKIRPDLWILLLCFLFVQVGRPAVAETARIGVLAHRGTTAAEDYWRPLATYLTAQVEGWEFELVPVTLVSAAAKISAREIDLLITNPGHFVELAARYPMSALATLERSVPGDAAGLLYYGTVVFARRDADLASLGSLRGKSLAAVSPDAFGGFQLAWSEIRSEGIDPFSDLSELRFMGFPQDAIVAAVARGDVDAGVVRSGLLEALDRDGLIDKADFVVLNSSTQPDYPFQVTGHLYPEWPFVAMASAPKDLRETVSLALLRTRSSEVRRGAGLVDAWSSPLHYDGVRSLVERYRSREDGTPVARDAWWWAFVAFASLIGAGLGASLVRRRDAPPVPQPAAVPPAAAETTGDEDRERFQGLTRRELQILGRVCAGESSRTIAEDLNVSVKTVEFHRGNLLRKTGAGTTAHLVQMATRLGFDLGDTPVRNAP